jgi:hypothetical protein
MTEELGGVSDDALGATVPLRKSAAEFVDGLVGIDADGGRVSTDERARLNAGRPAGEVVALETVEQFDADARVAGNLFERQAGAYAPPPQVRSEGIAATHGSRPQGQGSFRGDRSAIAPFGRGLRAAARRCVYEIDRTLTKRSARAREIAKMLQAEFHWAELHLARSRDGIIAENQ